MTARTLILGGLLALFARGSEAQVFVPGDLNDDDSFDIVDDSVLRRALGSLPPGITQTCVALPGDVNANSAVDAVDSTVLRSALVGLPPGISQTCADPDADDDGFAPADGDCDDSNPFVNPAAFDFVGNGLDDDCTGGIDTPRPSCDGGLPSNASSPISYALAMDLCQTAVESPPENQRTWGVISGAFALASNTGTPSAVARSIRSTFGTNNGPRFGLALAVLSTGSAAAQSQTNPAYVQFQPGNSLASTSDLPPDWLAANGGTSPVAPGCPSAANGTQGNDSIMLRLRIRVPSNARSFRLAAKHFSADYPEFTCATYNDYFLVLLDSGFSGAPANPADKNLAVVDGVPVGVNLVTGSSGLFQDCLNGAIGCGSPGGPWSYAGCVTTAGLTGTGMQLPDASPQACSLNDMLGGATTWLGIRGNVEPGEVIELRILVWDVADGLYDSLVLLDDFRWSPTTITPGTIAD